jgi:hypothetical protein
MLAPAGSSPDADTEDDDDDDVDDELQRALALSMHTYEAEQQHGMCPAQQQHDPGRQLNKRSNSPAAAGPPSSDGIAAAAGTALAAPAKKPRSSNSPWQQPAATADGSVQPHHSNSSIVPQGASAADANAGFARPQNSAAALLLASSGLLALGQAPHTLQLLALQQHNMQQQQHDVQQQQRPAAGGLLAHCMPSPACGNPQQPAAAAVGAQRGLGRSGSVQDLGQLAGNATAAAVDDDLYDLGDWDEEGDDDAASRGSGGSGVAGMYAHYSAMQLNEQSRRQQQQHQQQQQQPNQQQHQHQHQLGLPRSGRGSEISDVGARRLYQLREPVWYVDPLFQTCFLGCIFGADAALQEGSGSNAVGGGGGVISRYIVDLQCAAVRYVEATAAQLLPRLCIGDWVWCKPSMADVNQLGAASKLRLQRQQQQQQQQQQQDQQQQEQQQQRDPWISAEWVLGQVVNTQVHGCVPVCEVRLADGDSCWFPNIHLEQVREVGESSSAAEARGIAQLAAPTAVADEAAAEAPAAADLQQQQQQQGQLSEPHQQQPDQTAGLQQQQQCTGEMPLVPSSGSGPGLHGAGSTGSMQGAAQGSCGAAASPDAATAGADSTADAAAMDMDAAPAAAAGPAAADVAVIQAGSLRSAAATAASSVQHVAADEEVADSSDLLLLPPWPPAQGAGDSSGHEQAAAQAEAGRVHGPVGQQLPAAAVAVAEVQGL